MRRQGLLWQSLVAYVAISLAGIMLASLYAAHTAHRIHLEDVDANLERAAQVVARLASDAGPADGFLPAWRVGELARLLGMRITVISPTGVVLADSEEDPRLMDNHLNRPEIAQAASGTVGRATRFSDTLNEERVYVAVGAYRDGVLVAIVRTSVPVRTLGGTLWAVYERIALAGLALTAVMALASLWATRRVFRPLEQVRAGAERLARGELEHRLRVADAGDVAILAETLNRMADQLDQRTRTALRQQNEQEAVLASTEEGVLALDLASRIIQLNEACARILGIPSASSEGRLLCEVVRKTELLQFAEKALAAGEPIEQELCLVGELDRRLYARARPLFDADRQKIGALLVLDDVTRLRHLENLRRDFVANVSHELRTPVTSIRGFVETLLDESLEDRDNALRFLQSVLRQIKRLEAIIDDLLSLSRIERGEESQSIALATAPLEGVLHAAIEICQPKADEKQIALVVQCPADLAAPMNAPLLEQAIVNLVDNAIKYSLPGTTVRVEAQGEESGVVLRVSDQGCGIAAKHLPRLFERFYRVDHARSRELGGTGLGLAIVKHIVAAHRGSVGVESTPGKGSTFWIRLPGAGS
jgi:two-component system phosphate regulon sensor histidine kinase PhoR